MLEGSGKLFVSGRVKQKMATTMLKVANMIKGIVGSMFLPRSAIIGAIIPPILPNVEQSPIAAPLAAVGNSSEV